jgi:hypothetical protein
MHPSVMQRVRQAVLGVVVLGCLLPSPACFSARKKDCAALLDVEAVLARDMRTYEDPKTPREAAQNWRDTAKKIDKAFDQLGRVSMADPRVLEWASRTRAILPLQFALASKIATAREKEDWPSYEALRNEWETNAAKLAGIKEDAIIYCQ